MEITGADAPSRVEIALQFLKPFKASNTTTFEKGLARLTEAAQG